jgi:hypothetical protein
MNRKCKIERKNKREVFTFLLDPLSRVSKKKREKRRLERGSEKERGFQSGIPCLMLRMERRTNSLG